MSLKSISDYFQPDFYHFTEDSIILAKQAVERIAFKFNGKKIKAIDLCAGCGVIGLEVLQKSYEYNMATIIDMDFCELQSDFINYFEKNMSILDDSLQSNIRYINKSINYLRGKEYVGAYDLIFCNPPYYLPGKKRLSQNKNKNYCKFFIEDSFSILVDVILGLLRSDGEALIILPNSIDTDFDLLDYVRNKNCHAKVGKLLVKGSIAIFLITILHEK